jgi:dinuclear metal center YbgI/SA1388 family protein
MASVQDVLAVLEQIAPTRYAFPWDKVGLQVGDPRAEVRRGLVALDRSLLAISKAGELGAQVLLTHHPLIFEPLNSVTTQSYEGRAIQQLLGSGIAHVAAHTNWDAAAGGINDALATRLSLSQVSDFGSAADANNCKLVFFVPASHLNSVIDACSDAGAGGIGDYSRCAYYSARMKPE